ncbi:MAG: sarcosine oxidase subunit gamma [Hellea sp.]|nr:sarcosine oxidase subunit gamma [Hellea sp.]
MSFDIKIDQGVEIPEVLQSGRVVAELAGEKVRLSLRVKSADRTAVAKALGFTLPAKIGATSSKVGITCACLGPDEWIVIADQDKGGKLYGKALKLASKYDMSVTDVSFRNIGITVTGEGAADMINVGCPLDLRLAAFPVGSCTRSVYEAVPILLYRRAEDSFTVECWRSFAPYVVGLMAAHRSGAAST